MAGHDSFLLLMPILMLAVVALLVFVGCDQLFGINAITLPPPPPMLTLEANPGIPQPGTRITPVDLTWNTDANGLVNRSTLLNGPYGTVGEAGGSYTDTTVTDGTTYYYTIGGDNGVGGPVSVTPQPPFVTAFNTLGAVANNFSGFMGMAIRIGGNPVMVYALGRLMVAGNNSGHEIWIVDPSNGSPFAKLIVYMAGGTPGSFVYSPLSIPINLNANTDYYVVSSERVGGDQWHTDTTTLATTSVAAVIASVSGTGTTYTKHTPGATYGPLDFLYL
jgi:hypothetical protein